MIIEFNDVYCPTINLYKAHVKNPRLNLNWNFFYSHIYSDIMLIRDDITKLNVPNKINVIRIYWCKNEKNYIFNNLPDHIKIIIYHGNIMNLTNNLPLNLKYFIGNKENNQNIKLPWGCTAILY